MENAFEVIKGPPTQARSQTKHPSFHSCDYHNHKANGRGCNVSSDVISWQKFEMDQPFGCSRSLLIGPTKLYSDCLRVDTSLRVFRCWSRTVMGEWCCVQDGDDMLSR